MQPLVLPPGAKRQADQEPIGAAPRAVLRARVRDERARPRPRSDQAGRPHSAPGHCRPAEFLSEAIATAAETFTVSALPLDARAGS